MRVKANVTIAYKGIEYDAGDVFEMDNKTAKVNIVNKRVSEARDDTKEKKPKRGESAETLPADNKPGARADTLPADSSKDEKDAKGRYKRRDMHAEGEHSDDDGET